MASAIFPTALGRRSSAAVHAQVRKLEVAAQTLHRAQNAIPTAALLCRHNAEGRGHVREKSAGPKMWSTSRPGMCQDALEPFADLFAGFANLQPVTPNLGQELEIMHSQPAEMS